MTHPFPPPRPSDLLAVADPIRESARGAIDALRSDGLRIVMLTGDNATTANAVARIVGGLDEVRAQLKPEDKAQAIAELKASGAKIAMARDGINDAHAFSAAHAVLAVGTGTAVAIVRPGLTLTLARQSVVLGQSGSRRVDPLGRRIN